MISLVLASVGRAEEVDGLLQSLLTQRGANFELIVVDQNADDRLAAPIERARGAGLAVTHLRLAQANLSAARNLGIEHARGDVIGFPDDDCWYEPDVVASVAAAFAAHPEWTGVVAQWVEQAQARDGAAPAELLSAENWRRFRDGDASSISLFIRADALRACGGFDARLGVGQWFGAGEETDLILALLSRGALLARCPQARVHHRYTGAAQAQAAVSWRAALRRARGTGALYAKHRLSAWVALRGFIAPPLKACRPWRGSHALKLGLATSAGRLQGTLAWLLGRHR
ncbi:MAG: glycosyltransferase family 2 protein [Rubrivivax sp.]|nr:glycosyltransferase family 2 protein [Rubrivivax sp.]